jgi:hypothetical protein
MNQNSEARSSSAPAKPQGPVILDSKVISQPGASLRVVEYRMSRATKQALNVGTAKALEGTSK